MNNVSLDDIKRFVVPVPPAAEQRRIVAKVNELMSLCDKLETQLANVRTDSIRLRESVFKSVLDPDAERSVDAA